MGKSIKESELKNIISISIVLYNSDPSEITKLLECLFRKDNVIVYLIDNSISDSLRVLEAHNPNILYIHNPRNPGFGAAHNIAIQLAITKGYKYHFIVNPDIYFNGDVMSPMIEYMKGNLRIGMLMPQILNLDGTIQSLPKLLPSPYSIIMRKFKKPIRIYERFINKYELRLVDKNQTYSAPILSGCFTLLNLDAIKEVGMYDDRFFMYFEDWDLSRRMHQKYETIYFPEVSIYHGYESGANKNRKLFVIFIKSAIAYFNKWGWFLDSEREKINNEALSQFK